uniref:Ycf36 n=1 Tax=Gelidium elegans TaxID=37200 RepID=A0A141SDB2_GELEL|nr:hypothetical protein Gele_017 [Gelidium elegans]AMK96280.1 hypothetical protein Gele_017 [Gelidium elegans]
MCISKKICPVPYDQQPINEYASLKQSCFFAWSTFNISYYIMSIGIIFCVLFIICLPVSLSLVSSKQNLLEAFIFNFILVTGCLLAIFTRLYLGWSYIVKRLVSASVFYEESGWYDGQIWVKTVDSLTKDRLIGAYEVRPLISRVQYSFICAIMCFALEISIYYLL